MTYLNTLVFLQVTYMVYCSGRISPNGSRRWPLKSATTLLVKQTTSSPKLLDGQVDLRKVNLTALWQALNVAQANVLLLINASKTTMQPSNDARKKILKKLPIPDIKPRGLTIAPSADARRWFFGPDPAPTTTTDANGIWVASYIVEDDYPLLTPRPPVPENMFGKGMAIASNQFVPLYKWMLIGSKDMTYARAFIPLLF